MIELFHLPAINASLNAVCAVLLLTGWALVRRGRLHAHVSCMVGAMCVSLVFLASYLVYHFHAGTTRFPGVGWARTLYFTILISHTILAAALPALVLLTVYRAARRQFDRHRRLARWTLPLWLYVSVSGVLVYVMLYHLYPQPLPGAGG